MHRGKFKYIILLFFLSVHHFFYAQNKGIDYNFEYLTTEHGLSSNRNNCVYRDSEGFLWIGSEIGLDRYDGYSIKKYKSDSNKPGTISNDNVHRILEDSDHNLWFGTADGLNRYNRDLDSFVVYRNVPADNHSLAANNVLDIYEDAQKNLWIITNYGYLHKWNKTSGNFDRFAIPNNQNNNLLWVSRLIDEDSKGRIWIVAYSSDLFMFNPLKGEFLNYKNRVNDLGNCDKSIYIDSEDKIWIYSYMKGLMGYNPDLKTIGTFKALPDGKGLNQPGVIDVIEEDRNYLLIAVDNGGINRLNKRTGRFEYFIYDKNKPGSVSTNNIWNFYRDKQGILYISGNSGGIGYYNPIKNRFRPYNYQDLWPDMIIYSFPVSFSEDKRGKIWFGTDGLGIITLDTTTGNLEKFNFGNKFPGKIIKSIDFDSNQNLWINSWDNGLVCYEYNTGRIIKQYTEGENKNLISDRIYTIKVDHRNNVWAGLSNGGILVIDKNKGTIKKFSYNGQNQNSLLDGKIWNIYEDDKKNMWICTSTGLCRFDSIKSNFVAYKNLPEKEIRSVYTDKQGNIWVGTASKGLCLLDPKGNLLRNYSINNRMVNNSVMSIQEDNSGNIWITTPINISKLLKDENKFINYSTAEVISDNGISYQTLFKTKKGKLFFGSLNQLNYFNPENSRYNNNIPKVVITDFFISNIPVMARNSDGLYRIISQSKSIVLKANQNDFSFAFTATDFTSPKNNQYAYKLEKYNEDWIYTDYTRRFASYTNLDPGEYTFRVIASNNDGVWNETGTSVHIIIKPNWWKTWWFRIPAFIFIVSLFGGSYYIREKNHRLQQKILKEMVKQRTLELEESNRTLLNLNHSLEEQQEEISQQKEELINQKEELQITNQLLEEQKERILNQNDELFRHRNELESLVEERTKQLLEAKLKAEESDKLKSSFLANISHEIRTPMNAIIGFSGLLREENLSIADRDRFLDIINLNSQSLLNMINNVVDLSKLETGQIQLTLSEYLVQSLLLEILSFFQEDFAKKGIELVPKFAENPELILKMEKVRIKQVLENLVSNALKFTESGTVSFGVSSMNDFEIVFFVSDTGIGIPNSIGDAVFDRFTKVEEKKKLFRGSGLGLAISKRIVELWGGKIWYESKLNEGTAFYFTHPI
ncbi:MAG: two-component regulator propeller domain-containing protein [Bacteroidales bacterium]